MADGSLIFDTKIDNSGMDKGLTATEVKAKKAVAAVEKQTKVVQGLQAKLRELSSTPAKTEEYAKLEQSFQAADNKLQGLIDRQDKFLASGGNTNSAAWKSLQYDIEKVADEVREYQAQMDRLKADGGAFTSQDAEIANVTQQLNAATLKAEELQVRAQEAGQALKDSFKPAPGAVDDVSASMGKLTHRFGLLLKRAFVFSVIYKGLSLLKKHIAEVAVSNDELRNALGRVKGALQNAFTPIMNKIIPLLTSLANALANVISYITAFFRILGGGGGGSSTSMSLMGNVEALNAESAALMGVAESAKEAEKSMANFDEINQLQNKAGGGGGGGGGGAEIPTIDPGSVELPKWLVDLAERLADAFERIGAAVKKIGDSKAFQLLMTFFQFLAQSVIADVIERIAAAIESLAAGFEFFDKLFSRDLIGALESWWESVKKIWAQLDPVFALILKLLELNWGQLWEDIKTVLKNAWEDIVVWWNTKVTKWWNDDVKPWFTKERWAKLWEDIKAAFIAGWQAIVTWWNSDALVRWFNDSVKPWFTRDKWNALWVSVKTWFTEGWAAVVTWWNSDAISKWFNDDVKPWFTKEKWLGILGGIKDAFSSAFDDAAAAVKGILNKLITAINSFFNVSFSGLSIGGKEIVPAFSTQLLKIPYLAQGAVIPPNREFMAVLGDQKRGTNIEAPLDTIVAAFRKVTGENGGGGKGEATMEVDGQAFGRLVYKYGTREAKRIGVRLVGV